MKTENIFFLRLLISVIVFSASLSFSFAQTKTSTGTGNWNEGTKWTPAGVPAAGDNIIIAVGHNITANVAVTCASLTVNNGGTVTISTSSFTVNGTTTVDGTLTDNSNTSTDIFVGKVTINSTGTWNTNSVTTAGRLEFRGGIEHKNSTVGSFNCNVANFTTNPQTITVTAPMSFAGAVTISAATTITATTLMSFTGAVTISANTILNGSANTTFGGTVTIAAGVTMTNSNTEATSGVIFTGALNGANATTSIFVNQGILSYRNSAAPMNTGVLTATAAGNKVIYNLSGNQTIKGTSYQTLILDASGNKDINAGTLTVDGTTTIQGAAVFTDGSNTGTNTFTGKVTVNAGAGFNPTSSSAHTFSGGIEHNGVTFNISSAAVNFNTTQSLQGISAMTFGGNITINSPAIVTNQNAVGITVNGVLNGDLGGTAYGWVNDVNSILNYGASTSTTAMFATGGELTATATGNTVNYNRNGGQIVRAVNYWNLGASVSGAKTLGTNQTINGNLIISGTASFSPSSDLSLKGNFENNNTTTAFSAAAGTTLFLNGTTAQTIGGTSATTFSRNVTLNNAAGFSLSNSETIGGILTLTSGKLALGNNGLSITNNIIGAIAGTFSSSNMIVTDGTGKLIRTVAAGNAYVFPVGDIVGTNEYSPATITPAGIAGGTIVGISVKNDGKDPNNSSGDDYLNRYWNISTPITSNITAQCTYISPSDVVGLEPHTYPARWDGSAWTKNGTAMSGGTFTVGPTNFSTITSLTGVDGFPPTISNVQIISDNRHTDAAKVDDEITVSFTASEPLNVSTAVTIAGQAATLTNVGLNYTAKYTMQATDAEGIIPFSITFSDAFGNAGTGSPKTTIDAGTNVTFDKTPPTAANVNCIYSVAQNVPGNTTVTLNNTVVGCANGGLATDSVWFAPNGSVEPFIAGTTKTATTGSSNSILAPTTTGANYKLYVIDYAGNVSAPSTMNLTVYNPPTLSNLNGVGPTYTENDAAVTISSTITAISDANLTSATISITAGYISVAGGDILDCTNPNGLTENFNNATGILTLTGSATAAIYEVALRSITFINNQHPPIDASTRTLTYSITDETYTSNSPSTIVTVRKFNFAPTFSSIPVTSAQEWNTYTYNVTLTDDDPTGIVTTCLTCPTWLTFTPSSNGNGTLSGNPTDDTRNVSVTLQAVDGPNTATQSFTINVSFRFDVPGDAPTINAGIDSCQSGDLIFLVSTNYTERIDFKGKNLEIRGNPSNPAAVTIDGGAAGSVVTFKSGEGNGAKLNGVTIKNGIGTLKNHFVDSYHSPLGYYGGGIYCWGASPTLTNVIVTQNSVAGSGNTGGSGGGIYIGNGSSPIFTNVTVSNNTAQIYRGGGICVDNSSLTYTSGTITGNSGGNYGGGIAAFNSTISLNNISITSNNVTGFIGCGGGMYIHKCTQTLNTITVSGNSAKSGTGRFSYGSTTSGAGNSISGDIVIP